MAVLSLNTTLYLIRPDQFEHSGSAADQSCLMSQTLATRPCLPWGLMRTQRMLHEL